MSKATPPLEFLLPVNWAHFLVNNGLDGYSKEELDAMKAWVASNQVGACLSADLDNTVFTWWGDDLTAPAPLGADRCTFYFP